MYEDINLPRPDFLDDISKCPGKEPPTFDVILNVYLVSKGLRRMCLYCGVEIPHEFREWIRYNGHKYEIKMIYDDRHNCYFLNTNDSYIHMGIPAKEEIGTLLEYYQPYQTVSTNAKNLLVITFRRKGKSRKDGLFSQFSTEEFPKEYIDALLTKFNSISKKIGYIFGSVTKITEKGSICNCSCCI